MKEMVQDWNLSYLRSLVLEFMVKLIKMNYQEREIFLTTLAAFNDRLASLTLDEYWALLLDVLREAKDTVREELTNPK